MGHDYRFTTELSSFGVETVRALRKSAPLRMTFASALTVSFVKNIDQAATANRFSKRAARDVEFRSGDLPPGTELFRGLNRADVDLILSAARPRRFTPKANITHQGEPADCFHLLWKGRARTFFETPDGRKMIQIWITPGHIVGGAALIYRPSVYLVSSEAVRDSVVLAWDGETFRSLARRAPLLWENALFIAANYISWYVLALAALSSQDASERLTHVLLSHVASIGERVPGGIELSVTNEEVASSANVTPFTASRVLSKWQKAGLIKKARGRILVPSPKELFLQVSLAIGASSDENAELQNSLVR